MKELIVELNKDLKGIRRIVARDGRRQAREALKQTNKTFNLATDILGNSTRSHLAGAFGPAPVSAPAPDESTLGKLTSLFSTYAFVTLLPLILAIWRWYLNPSISSVFHTFTHLRTYIFIRLINSIAFKISVAPRSPVHPG
jgi:hypothetical protein